MQFQTRDAYDVHRDTQTNLPERAEIAAVFQRTGAFDGFSLEWVLDRVEQSGRAN